MNTLYRRVLAALALLAAMALVAACGETKEDQASGGSGASQSESPSSETGAADPNAPLKTGLSTVSIPKQLGNPYEEFEHSGIDEAMKELGGSNKITGPTDASASSQISFINAASQQKADAIIIAGNDPGAVAPALKQAAQRGVEDRRAWTPTSPRTRAACSSTRSRPSSWARTRSSRSASRSTTRARSRSSRRPPTRRTRTPGST